MAIPRPRNSFKRHWTKKAEPKILPIGITDGINTEVFGELGKDVKVVTDEMDDDSKKKKGKLF